MYVCVCACVCVCVCVFMCIYICIYICVCVYIYVYICIYICIYSYVYGGRSERGDVCYGMLRPKLVIKQSFRLLPSQATPGPPLPYRPLQKSRYYYPRFRVGPASAWPHKWGAPRPEGARGSPFRPWWLRWLLPSAGQRGFSYSPFPQTWVSRYWSLLYCGIAKQT